MSSPGTTPAGTHDPQQAARWVRGMFGRVARRYDLLNRLLSFQVDRYWRWRTVRRLREALQRPGARALDLCCGTGDLLLAIERCSGVRGWGSDFCHPMLEVAKAKIARKRFRSKLFEADALELPLRKASFDVVTLAFGFRNLADYRQGLLELKRLLRPGGVLAILEFTPVRPGPFGSLYGFYSSTVLPAIGGLISGSREAYTYLPQSVAKFPDAETLAQQMREAGFTEVEFERMTGGIVALHLGRA